MLLVKTIPHNVCEEEQIGKNDAPIVYSLHQKHSLGRGHQRAASRSSSAIQSTDFCWSLYINIWIFCVDSFIWFYIYLSSLCWFDNCCFVSLINDLYYTPERSVGTRERENREGIEGDRRMSLFMQIFKKKTHFSQYFDEVFKKKMKIHKHMQCGYNMTWVTKSLVTKSRLLSL